MSISDLPQLGGSTGIVPGRACGTCTMCCKVLGVEELGKARGQWCLHCAPQKGCKIYAARPASCREFTCNWMLWPELGPEWKPERSKVVIYREPGNRLLIIDVDPGSPLAWRKPSIYRQLKSWALAGCRAGRLEFLVTVKIGRQYIVVLADRDVELGNLDAGEAIASTVQTSSKGVFIEVRKVSLPPGRRQESALV